MNTSINTNIAAYYAQANIAAASNAAQSSVARLSSGNAIVEASDNVAALATGTSLATQVNALNTALTNASQGSSLLQVADGALAQIQSILQQQQSLALQAGSGSLTDTDRAFLNQQFQALSSEIDSLSGSTTFNGVNLIDGSLSNAALVNGSTQKANGSQITIGLVANGVAGNTITVNGVKLTAATSPSGPLQFKIGTDTTSTIANLAQTLTALAASTATDTQAGNDFGLTYSSLLGQATYTANGSTLQINSLTGGALSNNFSVDTSNTNSSLISGTKANIGGNYGGTSIYMFQPTSTGEFASATSSVTAASSATITNPFVAGNTITASVGSNAAVSLYTLKANDSLTNIVNGINSNTVTTGITAALTYDPTQQEYNIQLHSQAANSTVAINGGAGFYNAVDQTHILNGATSSINLFTTAFAATLSGTVSSASPTATSPFKQGDTISVSLAGAAPLAITSALGGAETLTSIVDNINSNTNAKTLGIHAALTGPGNDNIKLTYSDSTVPVGATTGAVLSLNGGSGFYNTDATGSGATNGLNTAYSNIQVFDLGFSTADTSITATTATAANPFATGDAMTADVTADGVTTSAIALGTVVAGSSLQDIAATINASTGAKANGIHAQVVVDSSGLYNLQLNAASSAVATNIKFHPGAAYYQVGTNYNLTTPSVNTIGFTTSATGAAPAYTLLTGTTSTALTAGQAVVTYAQKNMFTDALASGLTAGASVVGASGAANTPFANGGIIQASLGGGAFTSISSALTTGETLAQVVSSINASAGATTLGLKAQLDTSGTNILFSYTGEGAASELAFSGGAGFYDVGNGNATNGLNNPDTVTSNLFAVNFAGANGSAVIADVNHNTAAAPFDSAAAASFTFKDSSGTLRTVSVAAAAYTVATLTTAINANAVAQQYGLHATLVNTSGTNYNIAFSVANSGGVGNDPTVTNTSVGYDNADNAFAEGTLTQNIAAVTTFGGPFLDGANLQASINGGAKVTIAALAAGDTLAQIVTKINANTVGGNATGIAATLNGAGTNINLTYTGVLVNPTINVSANGTNFNTLSLNAKSQPNIGLNTSYSTFNLFATSDMVTTIAATTSTNTSPFQSGATPSDLTLALTGAGYPASIDLGTLGAQTTIQSLVSMINESAGAQANGIHADLVGASSGSYNIALTIQDKNGKGIAPATATFSATHSNFGAASALSTVASGTGSPTYVAVGPLTGTSSVVAAVGADSTSAQHLLEFGGAGGQNNGLGLGSTSISGTVGDSILTALGQTSSSYTIGFPSISSSDLATSSAFQSDGSAYLTVAGINFGFTTDASATAAPNEIQIGSTLQQTLDNAVSTINNYAKNYATGEAAYDLNQFTVSRNADSLVFTGNSLANPTQTNGNALSAITLTNFGNTPTYVGSSTLANASSTYGVDTSGIGNTAFTGSIGNFSATYANTANEVNLSVKVGNYTYTASNVPTDPSTNQTIRFESNTLTDGSNGGYFDVQLAAGQGQTVNAQSGSSNSADQYAAHLNAAFSTLSFNQQRQISSYNGSQTIVANGAVIGSLVGSSVSAQLSDFNGAKLTGISITPAVGTGDAKITLNIGSETFTSASGLGGQLGANQTFRLTSTTNANDYINFTTGASAINLSSSTNTAAVQTALSAAFGATAGSGALTFQLGSTSASDVAVSIGDASSSSLFSGQALDISTQAGATVASSAVDTAINTVTALRAGVGALESQFNFASAALQTSEQNQNAARGSLLDTDIASESTSYATSQVKLQAGISVLAQANQSLQALLKLIG